MVFIARGIILIAKIVVGQDLIIIAVVAFVFISLALGRDGGRGLGRELGRDFYDASGPATRRVRIG